MNIDSNENYRKLLRMAERAEVAEQKYNAGNTFVSAAILSDIRNNTPKEQTEYSELLTAEAQLRETYEEYMRLKPFMNKVSSLGSKGLVNSIRKKYLNDDERIIRLREVTNSIKYAEALAPRLLELKDKYRDAYTKMLIKGQKSIYNNNKTLKNRNRELANLKFAYENQIRQLQTNRQLHPGTVNSYIKLVEGAALSNQYKRISQRKNNVNKPINTDPEPPSNSNDPTPHPPQSQPKRRGFFSRIKNTFTRKNR